MGRRPIRSTAHARRARLYVSEVRLLAAWAALNAALNEASDDDLMAWAHGMTAAAKDKHEARRRREAATEIARIVKRWP